MTNAVGHVPPTWLTTMFRSWPEPLVWQAVAGCLGSVGSPSSRSSRNRSTIAWSVRRHRAQSSPTFAVTAVRLISRVHVSGGTHFTKEVRAAVNNWETPSEEDWNVMRRRHDHGDRQIEALFGSAMTDESLADLSFTPELLRTIDAHTLIVAGDRDRVYLVEMAVDLCRSIANSQLWVVPDGPHKHFAEIAREFVCNHPRSSELGGRPRSRRRVRGLSSSRRRDERSPRANCLTSTGARRAAT